MTNVEQANKLNIEIKEKGDTYQSLLDELQNTPPTDAAELFRLKRRLIILARETAKLIKDYNNLSM